MALSDTPLYARLRTVRPARVFALLGSDRTPRELAIAGTKGKWERVIRAALELDADALEFQDHEGRILELWPMREEEAEPDEVSTALARAGDDEVVTSDNPTVREAGYLTALVADAVDRAVDRQGQHQTRVLDSALRLVEVLTERLGAVEAQQAANLKAQERALERLEQQTAAGGGGAGNETDELLKTALLAFMAQQAGGGMLSGLLGGGAPKTAKDATPANGAAKT